MGAEKLIHPSLGLLEFQRQVDQWQDPAAEDADPSLSWFEWQDRIDPQKLAFERFFDDLRRNTYNGWTDGQVLDYLAWLFHSSSSDKEK